MPTAPIRPPAGPTAATTGGRMVKAAPWTPLDAWWHNATGAMVNHAIAVIAPVAVLALLAVVVASTRHRRGLRVTRRRLRVVLVPTESFNPNLEEILRYTNMITQARTPSPLLTPRWCRAMRIRLAFTPAGLAYDVDVPPWTASALRSALYHEVELHPLEVLNDATRPTPPPDPQSGNERFDSDAAIKPGSAEIPLDDGAEGADAVVSQVGP